MVPVAAGFRVAGESSVLVDQFLPEAASFVIRLWSSPISQDLPIAILSVAAQWSQPIVGGLMIHAFDVRTFFSARFLLHSRKCVCKEPKSLSHMLKDGMLHAQDR